MATQRERTVVYGAAIVQGIALVTFPAASRILTDPTEYDLSDSEYLPTIYAVAAGIAVAMGLWSLVVVGRRPSPTALQPKAG